MAIRGFHTISVQSFDLPQAMETDSLFFINQTRMKFMKIVSKASWGSWNVIATLFWAPDGYAYPIWLTLICKTLRSDGRHIKTRMGYVPFQDILSMLFATGIQNGG